MHVLIVALHRPSKPAGVCRHAANLARGLAEDQRITKVSLVIGAWQSHYFPKSFKLFSEKIELITVPIKNSSIFRNIWYLQGLPQLVNQIRPDIVHLSFPLPFIRSSFSCPIVTTVHDLYPYEYPKNFGYPNVWFNQLILKQCLNNSDGLACVSHRTLNTLNHYFPSVEKAKAVNVVYNYVDFENVVPRPLQGMTHLKATAPFLLSVAQHRKNKNLDLLIQAFATLLNDRKIKDSTQLVLVGDSGPETDRLRQQIQSLGLQDQVVLLASLSDNEILWLYRNCELLVVASAAEGFCLPVVEALSVACKVVCSDIPILREIGSEDCTYFDLQEAPLQQLAQAIVHAIAQPLPVQDGSPFRFSKATVIQNYLKFYSGLV